ncbi:MAG: cytochrome b561/polyisoprenoid-binding protein YceI [Arenicella sp.]|jgi:cytochrome b561/polyisoprenoid-binding protein YceI
MKHQYSQISQLLHWSMAGLIIGQFILAKLAERAELNDAVVQQLGLLANHKSIGMTILMLAMMRLLWRLLNPPPALPKSMPVWQLSASAWTHRLMYVLLFFIPVSGWLMSSATAYSVSWFNLFAFPDLVAADKGLAGILREAHEISTKLLFIIVVFHVLAAFKHHYIDKDEILLRMANKTNWLIFFSSAVLVAVLLGQPVSKAKQATSVQLASTPTIDNSEQARSSKVSGLIAWDIDYQNSHIKFRGDQAGAPFEGRWQTWQAEIKFDAEHLQDSFIDVTIEVKSVFSDDQERDQTIVDSDFFDVANHAQVRFLAQEFVVNQEGLYETQGQLTMKGLTKAAKFVFTIEVVDGQQVLIGESKLDRLVWNIGMGDWADTTWVGQEVDVKVRVTKRDL